MASVQNLAMDSPALHRGSLISCWILIIFFNWSHPLPSFVFIIIFLKESSDLDIMASLNALSWLSILVGTGISPPPSRRENSSKLTKFISPAPKNSTDLSVSFLWLCVLGILSTLAASAVTAISANKLLCIHLSLSAWATGSHSS